ncbi:Semaphorin-5B [Papilio xuthus]|uniref:Semaphorin-5B n=1 Tax=Papilio xuthus TaxID=66420 RepID=A0A0N0PA86_PAPXU|nr:Semaphorin-5B [Papilio xuthus]
MAAICRHNTNEMRLAAAVSPPGRLMANDVDTLYRLSLRGLRPLERSEWPAAPEKTRLCQVKGQTEEDCHNYIKVLLSYGHKLLACGTNAFSPMCSWREIEEIRNVSEWLPGVVLCPHSPHSNVTALLASNGEYYAGTPTDFASSDTTISSNSITGSAVCIYNMSDIRAAFEGPYKVQTSPSSAWESRAPSHESREHFRCATDTRDTLYRLSLRGLRPLERSEWPAAPEKTRLCQVKGQTEEDCHNYIKIEEIRNVSEWLPGVVLCPHSPHSNVTALLASNGEYYAGTPTDFASSDTTISR